MPSVGRCRGGCIEGHSSQEREFRGLKRMPSMRRAVIRITGVAEHSAPSSRPHLMLLSVADLPQFSAVLGRLVLTPCFWRARFVVWHLRNWLLRLISAHPISKHHHRRGRAMNLVLDRLIRPSRRLQQRPWNSCRVCQCQHVGVLYQRHRTSCQAAADLSHPR